MKVLWISKYSTHPWSCLKLIYNFQMNILNHHIVWGHCNDLKLGCHCCSWWCDILYILNCKIALYNKLVLLAPDFTFMGLKASLFLQWSEPASLSPDRFHQTVSCSKCSLENFNRGLLFFFFFCLFNDDPKGYHTWDSSHHCFVKKNIMAVCYSWILLEHGCKCFTHRPGDGRPPAFILTQCWGLYGFLLMRTWRAVFFKSNVHNTFSSAVCRKKKEKKISM